MAEWKQTLEPYVKVQERVITAALNPTVGEDLIVGVTFISDAGPTEPTLISSQKEFLNTYSATGGATSDYLNDLNDLYDGEVDGALASTMWANAYRLAGSTNLLCVRASKGDNIYFAKPLDNSSSQDAYILKDGELLKRDRFLLVIDKYEDEGAGASHSDDGWSIDVNGVGVFGNRVDDDGPQYDYYVADLGELVEKLNETSKFFSPKYEFYKDTDAAAKHGTAEALPCDPSEAGCVVLDEVYLADEFFNPDPKVYTYEIDGEEKTFVRNVWNMAASEITTNISQITKFHKDTWADPGVEEKGDKLWENKASTSEWFALNTSNTATPVKVRIRRFNHDAVITKSIGTITSLTESGDSPWTVIEGVLSGNPKKSRDFYEVAVLDPAISDTVEFFNLGNIVGRGDIEESELNDLLKMISLQLPDDLSELGLSYYGFGYNNDSDGWKSITRAEAVSIIGSGSFSAYFADNSHSYESLEDASTAIDASDDEDLDPGKTVVKIGDRKYYVWVGQENDDDAQIFVDLTIGEDTALLNVNDADLKRAMDKIMENEVYIVEGLCDLGNTDPSFQNYLGNMSISEEGNYFYPISTISSTNYMTVGNGANRISIDSYKLYMSAPWDIDTGTLGFRFLASPSVLFWEAVAQNYRAGRPYVSLFGQTYGQVNYQRPMCEFNKKQRQLLLSKKVNTAMWNVNTQIWQMNDNYTKQSENTIMNDEGNVRMGIHIAKVQNQLLSQFIGKKITDKLCDEVRRVEEYWIDNNIMTLDGNVPEAYQVFCSYDADLARQNKIQVIINVRFSRSLKFVNVLNRYFDTGMDISSAE